MGRILCGTPVGRQHRLSERTLELVRQAGIDLVEVAFYDDSFDYGNEEEVRRGAKVLASSGVGCRTVHLDFGETADISATDKAAREEAVGKSIAGIKAAPMLGAGIAVVHGSDEPIADGERPARLGVLRESLATLADAAAASGIRLALELLPRTCLANTVEEGLYVLEGLGEDVIGFCLDTNHINLREDPAEAVRRLGKRILTFHISDNDGVDERHWFPFEGVIDWPPFMKAVRDIDYEGQFILETTGSLGGDAVQYVKQLRARFDRLMALA